MKSSTTPTPNPGAWRAHIKPLYDAATVHRRIGELGAQITRDFGKRPMCVVGVLKGCLIFFADLIRAIDVPLSIEFIGISSYGDATKSSGIVRITQDLQHSIEGKDVLLVEDIVDTGLSMRYLLENFSTRRPASLRVCTLLEKPANAHVHVSLDYVGFRIPNHFVVGYGLDVGSLYRNLPFIGIYPEGAAATAGLST